MSLAVLVAAVATAGPITVDLDGLIELAEASFAEGPGAAWSAERSGLDRARRGVPFGPTALSMDSQLGDPAGEEVSATVEIPLHLGAAHRVRWRAEEALTEALTASARAEFVAAAIDGWTAWWLADRFRAHLDAWSEEVGGELARYRDAAADGLVAPLDVADLEAELVAVRSELAAVEAEGIRAEAMLEARLGVDLALPTVEDPDALPAPPPDPWTALLDRADAAPSVRAAHAEADALSAAGRALASEGAPTLQVGAMTMSTGSHVAPEHVPLAVVGVTVPLQPSSRPERRALAGRAEAARLDARWRAERRADEIGAEAVGYAAVLARAERLEREVIAPLEDRLVRLEAAFDEGLVTADRLVRARRDHHHAEHARIEVIAELLASEARARALALATEGR